MQKYINKSDFVFYNILLYKRLNFDKLRRAI